jgi:hypothetical protein
MIVCWLTLQISAASPVVKTVFMVTRAFLIHSQGGERQSPQSSRPVARHQSDCLDRLIHLSHLNIDVLRFQL